MNLSKLGPPAAQAAGFAAALTGLFLLAGLPVALLVGGVAVCGYAALVEAAQTRSGRPEGPVDGRSEVW